MARQVINVGTQANDGSGDPGRTGGQKINANFAELYAGINLVYANVTVPAGNTIANTVAETTFASSYIIPAGTLTVGSVIRGVIRGVYSSAAVAPTVDGRIKIGGVTVLDTGAISPLIGGASNLGWSAEFELIVTAIGAAGSVEAQGVFTFQTSTTMSSTITVENTATVTIPATTGNLLVTATVTWGTAAAANTATLRQFLIWIEKAVSTS